MGFTQLLLFFRLCWELERHEYQKLLLQAQTFPLSFLQDIFLFITRQLKGLEDTKSPQFNRYFYLLEVRHLGQTHDELKKCWTNNDSANQIEISAYLSLLKINQHPTHVQHVFGWLLIEHKAQCWTIDHWWMYRMWFLLICLHRTWRGWSLTTYALNWRTAMRSSSSFSKHSSLS